MQGFGVRLEAAVREKGVPACVGIDPFVDRIDGAVGSPTQVAARIEAFARQVIEAVAPVVPVVKPQSALFERWGAPGLAALCATVRAAREAGLVVIVDGKRGDIGSTAEAYAAAQLDDDGPMGADAATVSPYLGPESIAPYQKRSGKGIFLLLRTSNPGSSVWQLETGLSGRIADWIVGQSPADRYGDIGAVVGATLPGDEVSALRARMPRSWWLVPGFGAQGAGVEEVRPHFLRGGGGALITSSREVLFPREGAERDVAAGVAERAKRFAEAVARAAS